MRALAADLPVLGGRFRLARQIGEGGMGVVWQATDAASGQRCAIKFLRDASPEVQKRFFREAEAANAVRHPCILHIREIARDDDGSPAFVMDLLEGEPLANRIDRLGRLSLGQTAAILLPVLDALRAAHAGGVVHRDLKPDNIFITREASGTTSVRVLDFGIARLERPSEKLTVTGTLMGTPLYMSPEQASGEAVDARSDLWSIAALAFECLTGTTSVTGDNYGQILSRLIRRDVRTLGNAQISLPEDVVRAVDALFVDRSQRSADPSALANVLARHSDAAIDPPPLFVPPAQSTRNFAENGETMLDASTAVRPPTRAMPALVAVFAALAVVGTAAGTAAFLLRRSHAPTPAHVVTEPPPSATSTMTVATPNPPPSVSALASATTTSTTTAPTAVPRPVPGGRPTPTPSATGPKKLPGGVADAPGF